MAGRSGTATFLRPRSAWIPVATHEETGWVGEFWTQLIQESGVEDSSKPMGESSCADMSPTQPRHGAIRTFHHCRDISPRPLSDLVTNRLSATFDPHPNRAKWAGRRGWVERDGRAVDGRGFGRQDVMNGGWHPAKQSHVTRRNSPLFGQRHPPSLPFLDTRPAAVTPSISVSEGLKRAPTWSRAARRVKVAKHL